ncbi:MAG TPA: pyruvate kinase [Bacillus sp. (in: firmicutes)]
MLTEKDKEDLDFVCDHADIIGCSFVKDSEDIILVQKEIRKRLDEESAQRISLMVKMETVQGVQNLPDIIVTAAGQNPLCVMIARGDLAVEVGYLRLAELQEEILWICEAADIPVVWATQVLESMVKSGIPTRAEITDAAEGEKAECVMLNKGEYVLEGVSILNDILEKMQEHQYKKTSKLRALNMAKE